MEKETEEDTYLKVVRSITGDEVNFLEFCKLYHSERLKQLVPSSEEIRTFAKSIDLKSDSFLFFVKGAKWMRNKLLTKGQ